MLLIWPERQEPPFPSLYRPHPRHRSAVRGVVGAGVLPTVTVNLLNPDASGTLSPPASRAGLRWLRGDGKTSDWGDFGQSGQRSALGKPRTSRATNRTQDDIPLHWRVERWRRCTSRWTFVGGARCCWRLGVAGGIRFASERLRAILVRHNLMQGCINLEFKA